MKKIIAMGLVLTLFLTGCADGKKEQTTEKVQNSISYSEQESESSVPTSEELTTIKEEIVSTEEDVTIEEENEETEKVLTQSDLLLDLLEEDNVSAEAQIEAQSYLRPFELALYDLMIYLNAVYSNEVCEGIDYFDYFENQRYKYLFAWQLAECDPNIEKKSKDDPAATAGAVGILKNDFERYYMSLFGEKADIQILYLCSPSYGSFEDGNEYVYLHYYGGMQDWPPVLKNPKLQYESQTGEYLLSMDVLTQKEYRYINGAYHYVIMGEYINFDDPTITEYPQEYVFAKLIFRLNKTESGYHFKSIELKDINYETYTLAEGEIPLLGRPLTELLDMMPLDARPSDDLLVPLQAALYYDYQTAINALFMSDDGQIVIEKDYDYLSTADRKAMFVWYQIASGEKHHPTIVRVEGAENATGMYIVTVEDFSKCYRELLGEEVDFGQIGELECFFAPHDGKISGIGWLPGCESVEHTLKNPILSYDDASGEYILSMELINNEEYLQYDITEYSQKSVIGTIHFRMLKTENGYQFKSIVITD